MSLLDAFPCKLSTFEGPLDYLLYLVQQGEILLADIPLLALTQQFTDRCDSDNDPPLDVGAEFVSTTATLMWLKSKMLLPRETPLSSGEKTDFEMRLESLQQLVEYCSLKKAAEKLALQEEKQTPRHYRGSSTRSGERSLGLEEVTLTTLTTFFQQALSRTEGRRGTILPETWLVSDAIADLRKRLLIGTKLTFAALFTVDMSRPALIVTFLAILELMKEGEIRIAEEGICKKEKL